MAEHLQCGVCFEPYTAGSRLPKFLQCGGGIQHTYCLQCLRRLTIGGMIKCPCCGDLTSVNGRTAESLKNNIYLMPQIEAAAAAAARARHGLQMFCKTCSAVATEHCGEHQLLKMSELRDQLRDLASVGAGNMETVRGRRAEVMALFREAHAVLASVAESVRHTVEDYEMDVQLDDNIVSELERRREAAELLPADQLAESYRLTEQHASDATVALHDTAAVEQSRALLQATVSVTSDGGGVGQTFTVGEWLHSGDLMKALLAASVVVWSLDHVTAEEADDNPQNLKEGAHAAAAAKDAKVVDVKSSKINGSGDGIKSNSKPSSKSDPPSNGKVSGKSSKSAADAPVTKASGAAPDGKDTTSLSNGITTEKVSSSSKSNKTVPSSDKQAKKTTSSKTSTTDTTAPATKTNGKAKSTSPDQQTSKPSSTKTSPPAASTTEPTLSSILTTKPAKPTLPSTSTTKPTRVSASPVDAITKIREDVNARARANAIAKSVPTKPAASTTAKPASASPAKPASASTAKPAAGTAAKSAPTSTAKPAPTAAAKPKAPSFSTMVKSSAAAVEPAVQRPRRAGHPLYSLRVTNGSTATDVVIELRPDMAPIMCKNFIALCDKGCFDNSKFHFAVHADYLLGGRVDDDEGFSPLAQKPDKFVMADQCPLQDECGAIRMKGMGTVAGPGGEKRGLIGSQFMMWVSETRDYRQYQYTLVFGFIRQGLDFVRAISCMERPAIWRNARLLATRPYRE